MSDRRDGIKKRDAKANDQIRRRQELLRKQKEVTFH